MLEAILNIFVSEQKAQVLLSNQAIELIFMILLVTFIITLLIHVSLFNKLKKIRNYLKETDRMDIEPLRTFKEQFDRRQQEQSVKVETFVQEKFSSWRMFNIPVVSLIKMVQMTVSVFILVGVLGTFIGLTMSLSGIGSSGNQLVEDVASILSGIDVAFYTSIAGMGLSLIMTVTIKVANTEYLLTDIMLKVESSLAENEQDDMSRLIDVSESINQSIIKLQETNQQSLQGIENSFKGFQEYTAGLQQSAKDLAKFNEGLSHNLKDFHVLFHRMNEVTGSFDQASKQLNKNFDQLFSYFKRMDGRNERMANLFEETYEKMEEVSKTQMDTLHQFGDSVVDLKKFTGSIAKAQESVTGELAEINRKNHDLVGRMEEQNQTFKQVFGNDLSSKLAGITTYLSQLTKDFDKFGDSIVHLPEALKTINQTHEEYRHLLSDRFEELKEFNLTFHHHLQAHSADSAAFEKHLREATSTYEQVGIKNNQLINEMNATILQMNQSFYQRENQIEKSVGILKDTLSNYVTKLEGTLGDRLDKVGRNIGEYMESTNEGMQKEFKEMRLSNEEIQQNSARHLQQTLQELSHEIQRLNKQLYSLSVEAVHSKKRIRLNQDD